LPRDRLFWVSNSWCQPGVELLVPCASWFAKLSRLIQLSAYIVRCRHRIGGIRGQ
jgi:hypothetical protein